MSNTWQDSIRGALRSHAELEAFFGQRFPQTSYPIFVPLKLAEKIKLSGLDSPLAKQFLPHEFENNKGGMLDPIGDHAHSPTKQIVRRYKNRLLFFPTTVCPVQCRYCFRKNELHDGDELFKPDFSQVKKYISDNPEIQEVIFSGGDPLMLSNEKLEFYFDEFAKLGVPMLRLHTRMPVITPERLDSGLFELIKRASEHFKVVTILIHLNHADELSPEVAAQMKLFRSLPIHFMSQSVLLKGINDSVQALKDLFHGLLEVGIKPYYLHHPDLVQGGMHFWLPIEEGRKIFAALRDEVSGLAIPQYMVDIPGGHGKTPAYNPESFEFSGNLISKNGDVIPYFLN